MSNIFHNIVDHEPSQVDNDVVMEGLISFNEPMGEIKKYWREHSRIFIRKAL